MARETKLVNVQARWPQAKVTRLARLAERNGRSIASEVRIALDRHLALNSDSTKKGGGRL